MFSFSQLESFIKICFQFLFESIHFILLFLNQLSFSRNYLFVSFFHILFSLVNFQFLTSYLDLMSISVSIWEIIFKLYLYKLLTYFFYLAKLAWIFYKFKSSELNLKVNGNFSSSTYLLLSISCVCLSSSSPRACASSFCVYRRSSSHC